MRVVLQASGRLHCSVHLTLYRAVLLLKAYRRVFCKLQDMVLSVCGGDRKGFPQRKKKKKSKKHVESF